MIATSASDPVLITLIVAVVVLLGMVLLWWLAYVQRDRPTRLKKFRIGVFVERDLMSMEDLPKTDPWPEPPDDAIPHDAPTEEGWPPKR